MADSYSELSSDERVKSAGVLMNTKVKALNTFLRQSLGQPEFVCSGVTKDLPHITVGQGDKGELKYPIDEKGLFVFGSSI